MIRSLLVTLFLFFSVGAAAASEFPGDPKLTKLAWYPEKIELYHAWKIVDSAPDVIVAVVDMDFDLDHPELVDAYDLKLARDFSGNSFKKHSPDASYAQHGTLVSAIIGANGINKIGVSGILRRSHIIPLNWMSGSDSVSAIRFAVDHGARVINNSWGILSTDPKEQKELRDAVQYAADHDVLMVFSAGNYRQNSDVSGLFPATLTTEFDNLISVGGSDEHDRLAQSNYGKKTVDLFAPGKNIIVPMNRTKYDFSEGTSEAAPIVSGIAALMFQVNPKLHAHEVKSILMKTVDKVPSLNGLCRSGGRVNAFKAVQAAQKY